MSTAAPSKATSSRLDGCDCCDVGTPTRGLLRVVMVSVNAAPVSLTLITRKPDRTSQQTTKSNVYAVAAAAVRVVPVPDAPRPMLLCKVTPWDAATTAVYTINTYTTLIVLLL